MPELIAMIEGVEIPPLDSMVRAALEAHWRMFQALSVDCDCDECYRLNFTDHEED